jgi:hypothetical protein
MQNRRYRRLTNAFSKKAEMLAYSIAVTFTYHNFVRPHISLSGKGDLPRTPAMAAGIANRQWTIADLVNLADEYAEIRRAESAESFFKRTHYPQLIYSPSLAYYPEARRFACPSSSA